MSGDHLSEIYEELDEQHRSLQRKKANIQRGEVEDHSEADASLAAIDLQLAQVEARKVRAKSPPDDPALCFNCWVYNGDHLKMLPQPGEYGVDVFRCARGHERHARHR